MKPITLNVLLSHSKSDSLSFFVPPMENSGDAVKFELFFSNLLLQLNLEQKVNLTNILEKNSEKIIKILKGHPDKSHGFFIAEDLQGYAILDQIIEPYFMLGQTFHVRPFLEEHFSNPEFMLVNVSIYDVKIYRGDFQHLEIIQQYEFDELPKSFSDLSSRIYAPQYLGLIPYKTILALKTIAQKVGELILYHSLPVIMTGLEEIKTIFLRFFDHSAGVFSHFQEDFYEKTCVEITKRCNIFRGVVTDYYSEQLKERLKRMMSSKRFLSDLGEIIKATYEGRVVHLVIPAQTKLWGKLNSSGNFELDKEVGKKNSVDILNTLAEELIKQGGKIQILGPLFFPEKSNALAFIKGY